MPMRCSGTRISWAAYTSHSQRSLFAAGETVSFGAVGEKALPCNTSVTSTHAPRLSLTFCATSSPVLVCGFLMNGLSARISVGPSTSCLRGFVHTSSSSTRFSYFVAYFAYDTWSSVHVGFFPSVHSTLSTQITLWGEFAIHFSLVRARVTRWHSSRLRANHAQTAQM